MKNPAGLKSMFAHAPDALQQRYLWRNAWQQLRAQAGAHSANILLLIALAAWLGYLAHASAPAWPQRYGGALLGLALLVLTMRWWQRVRRAQQRSACDWLAGQPLVLSQRARWIGSVASGWLMLEAIICSVLLGYLVSSKAALDLLLAAALLSVFLRWIFASRAHDERRALAFLPQYWLKLTPKRRVWFAPVLFGLILLAQPASIGLRASIGLLIVLVLLVVFSKLAREIDEQLFYLTQLLRGQATQKNTLYRYAWRMLLPAVPALILATLLPLLMRMQDRMLSLMLCLGMGLVIVVLQLSAMHFSYAHRHTALAAGARTRNALLLVTLFALLLQAMPMLIVLLPFAWCYGYYLGNQEANHV
jgi:hypothetical protein